MPRCKKNCPGLSNLPPKFVVSTFPAYLLASSCAAVCKACYYRCACAGRARTTPHTLSLAQYLHSLNAHLQTAQMSFGVTAVGQMLSTAVQAQSRRCILQRVQGGCFSIGGQRSCRRSPPRSSGRGLEAAGGRGIVSSHHPLQGGGSSSSSHGCCARCYRAAGRGWPRLAGWVPATSEVHQ